MNALLAWARANLVLPLGMACLTACCATLYQSSEVDARQYGILAQTFDDGSSRYQTMISIAAEGGSISKWAYIALLREFWTDSTSLSVPDPDGSQALDTARAKLLARIKFKGAY